MTKLVGTAPNQVPTNADLGKLAYQDSIVTAAGGSMVYLASSGAISNAANVSFTQFDATKYDHYAFYFQHVIPATDNVRLFGYHSTDGGSSYDTTNGEYHNNVATDLPGFQINYTGVELGSDTNEYGVTGFAYLYAPHVAAYTVMYAGGCASIASNGGIYGHSSHSRAMTQRLAAEDTDAIRFAMDSGNIESGEITMFGIVNS